MEKLQAALARAREKRNNDGRPVRSDYSHSARSNLRGSKREAVDARWEEIPTFEAPEKALHKSRVYAGEATPEAQHFDILRTKLLLEMRRNNWTRIAITSATPGCGKTTMACNLIAGFGRQPEDRGILFDLDFRRPSVAKTFGAAPSASLKDVFLEDVEFKDQALRFQPNTAISVTTRPHSDPAQIILSSQTAEVLDQIQADYTPDLMLFDMPPILVSDETRGFLKLVDAVLILAAAENTTVAQIDEVEREVARYSNVAGIVLNKARFMSADYGYAY